MRKVKVFFIVLVSLLLALPTYSFVALAQGISSSTFLERDTGTVSPKTDEWRGSSGVSYPDNQYSARDEDQSLANEPDDQSGVSGDCDWVYTKSNHTLTVTGKNTGTTNIFPWEDAGPLVAGNTIRQAVQTVVFSNNVVVKTAKSMFQAAHALASIDFSGLNFTDDVTSLDAMFYGDAYLTSVDLSGKNLSQVRSLEATFACDYNDFDFTKNSHLATINLEGTGLSGVTNANNTFYACCRLETLKLPSVQSSKVFCPTSMQGFLAYDFALRTFDCSVVDAKNLTNMQNAFSCLTSVTVLDLSTWDTRKVTTMYGLFHGCERLGTIKGLDTLNTSNVTDMTYMFAACQAITSLDVSRFDVAKLQKMEFMFSFMPRCTTINVGGWKTDSLVDIGGAFQQDDVLENLDLSSWDVSNVTLMNQLFLDSPKITNPHIENWNPISVTQIQFFFCENNIDPALLKIFANSPLDDISALFQDASYDTLDLSPLSGKKPRYISQAFYNMSNLVNVDFSYLDTSRVRNMGYAFGGLASLKKLDFSNHDFSRVVSLESTFSDDARCEEIRLPNSPFGSYCETISGIFIRCGKLRFLNLVNLDVRQVTSAHAAFKDCINLERIYVSKDLFVFNLAEFDPLQGSTKELFANDVALKGEYGTMYQANHVDIDYAVIDSGSQSDAPGYLSQGFAISSENLQTQDMKSSYVYAGEPVQPQPSLSVRVDKVLPNNSSHSNSAKKNLANLYDYKIQQVVLPMEQDRDYSLAYFNNDAPGQATMRVIGEGCFVSITDVQFDIVRGSEALPRTGDPNHTNAALFFGSGIALFGAYLVFVKALIRNTNTKKREEVFSKK